MKSRMLLILCATSMMALTSVAKNDSQPPGKVNTEVLIASTNDVAIELPSISVELVAYSYTEIATINTTYFPESVSVAEPISAIVCPAVTQKVAEVELHDFGNDLNAALVGYQKQSSNTLLFERLYLTNCSIRQCFC